MVTVGVKGMINILLAYKFIYLFRNLINAIMAVGTYRHHSVVVGRQWREVWWH